MYSTCLFCTSPLGHNEVIEPFPVGRRLAFDSARGRLWVVCRKCGRWNLSPLEERWEAVEECERRFRATPLRASTDQIGLAKLREGLELVRIGRPERPEFAAWRYGDQFGRRSRQMMAVVAGSAAAGGILVVTGSLTALTAMVPAAGVLIQVPGWIAQYRQQRKIVTRVEDAEGIERAIRLKNVSLAQLVRSDDAPWALRVTHDAGAALLTGDPAVRVIGKLLASINHAGALQRTVRDAVTRLETLGGPERVFEKVAQPDAGEVRLPGWTFEEGARARIPKAALVRLPKVDRLALEMAAHEESERRALEGELATLEAEWREAEAIAAIADDLLLPGRVVDSVRRLRAP